MSTFIIKFAHYSQGKKKNISLEKNGNLLSFSRKEKFKRAQMGRLFITFIWQSTLPSSYYHQLKKEIMFTNSAVISWNWGFSFSGLENYFAKILFILESSFWIIFWYVPLDSCPLQKDVNQIWRIFWKFGSFGIFLWFQSSQSSIDHNPHPTKLIVL